MTLSINNIEHTRHKSYAEYRILFIVMLIVVMLSVVRLGAVVPVRLEYLTTDVYLSF